MKNKQDRLIDKIEKSGKKGVLETDLFYFHEMGGAIRATRTRIRKTLGFGKRLVIEGGVYFIERTGGIAGFITMAILVIVMSVLSYNAGTPNNIYECGDLFGRELIFEEDYLI